MGLHVSWRPEGVEVRLNFQLVSDPLRSNYVQKQGTYRLDFSDSLSITFLRSDWSFSSLFDRTIERSCPVAGTSLINVTLPQIGMYRITPEPQKVEKDQVYYDLESLTEPLDVKMEWPTDFEYRMSAFQA
jgi:GPI-anchor transamidase subunit T